MNEQQIQKARVKRLAQVGLWSKDVVAQAQFYRQVLGLNLHSTFENAELEDTNALLSVGEEYHCLGLYTDTRSHTNNGRHPYQPTRLHHLSFELDTDVELAAIAARVSASGVEIRVAERDTDPELGHTLCFNDPDGNLVELSVTPDDSLANSLLGVRRARLSPHALQHVALQTPHLELMVEFYTETLGFDISDWLLRESAWLRCNNDHHTLLLIQGKLDIDHVGYSISSGSEILAWADHLSHHQTSVLWGPGRHGAGNDLFLRFADTEDIHIELSAELQQYHDRDATTPPRLWHTRPMAMNLWGNLPAWINEEVRV